MPSGFFSYNYLNRTFNCSFDGKKTELDITQIDKTRLPLLLVWPGIILLKLAAQKGCEKSKDKLKRLETLLNNDTGCKEIQHVIEIELEEIHRFLLFFYPKSIHFPQAGHLVDYLFTLDSYSVLCCTLLIQAGEPLMVDIHSTIRA